MAYTHTGDHEDTQAPHGMQILRLLMARLSFIMIKNRELKYMAAFKIHEIPNFVPRKVYLDPLCNVQYHTPMYGASNPPEFADLSVSSIERNKVTYVSYSVCIFISPAIMV